MPARRCGWYARHGWRVVERAQFFEATTIMSCDVAGARGRAARSRWCGVLHRYAARAKTVTMRPCTSSQCIESWVILFWTHEFWVLFDVEMDCDATLTQPRWPCTMLKGREIGSCYGLHEIRCGVLIGQYKKHSKFVGIWKFLSQQTNMSVHVINTMEGVIAHHVLSGRASAPAAGSRRSNGPLGHGAPGFAKFTHHSIWIVSFTNGTRRLRQGTSHNFMRLYIGVHSSLHRQPASLPCTWYPHYARLKTIMGREEHLKHPVRAVAAAVSQARTGHGMWRICTGARDSLPRELRLCLHCDLPVVESVTHSLCVCPLNNDLRADMVTKTKTKTKMY